MKRTLSIVAITLLAVVLLGALVVGSGALSVAADEPHSSLVFGILDTARERSIEARAADIQVPTLDDAAMVRRAAGNYDAMCAKCHLAPGMDPTELSAGLAPTPPNLAKHAQEDAAEAFWVIKHGIKATGMPAWGKHMRDPYIWDLVAFLRKLPSLSAEQYQAEVAASGGHSHDGDDESAEAMRSHSETAETKHVHADGSQHTHSGPASGPIAAAKALHDALAAGDAARVQSLLDPEVVIMEGGNVERSRKEYAAHHLSADLKFMKGVTYELERQTGASSGDLAWVASEAAMTGTSGGKPVALASTETLVLKNVGGTWKAVHIHWSSKAAQER
jgi:mono/diheme cytochrome c family protein/ketosteroid isomerase-like protein